MISDFFPGGALIFFWFEEGRTETEQERMIVCCVRLHACMFVSLYVCMVVVFLVGMHVFRLLCLYVCMLVCWCSCVFGCLYVFELECLPDSGWKRGSNTNTKYHPKASNSNAKCSKNRAQIDPKSVPALQNSFKIGSSSSQNWIKYSTTT